MTWIRKILAIISLCVCATYSVETRAAVNDSVKSRPVTSVYAFEIGGTHDLSTYLSPLFYNGLDMAVSGIWTKDFQRWPDRCVMRFEADLDFHSAKNPAGTAMMYGLSAYFGWGLSWRMRFMRDWQVTVGPMLDIYGGAMYLARNGNNPVNAMAFAGFDVAASLSYKFKMGRVPCRVDDEIRVPTLGAFFCPGYGETYYEIYLGNRSDLVHFGWWDNAAGVNNLLSLRMQLGRTGLMLGYRLDLRTFHANHLQTQQLRNAFVIGIIP